MTAPGTAVPNFTPVTTTFKVKYSSLRSYRAILDLANPTVFSIVPLDGKVDGSEGDGGGPVITF